MRQPSLFDAPLPGSPADLAADPFQQPGAITSNEHRLCLICPAIREARRRIGNGTPPRPMLPPEPNYVVVGHPLK